MSQAISHAYYNEYTRKNLEDSSQFTLIRIFTNPDLFKVYAKVGIRTPQKSRDKQSNATTQKTNLFFREIYLGTCFIPASAKLDTLIAVKEDVLKKELIFPSILLVRTALLSSSSSSATSRPATSTMQQSEKLPNIPSKKNS